MAAQPQLSWLWKNEQLSDVTLHLCTAQRIKEEGGTHGSAAPHKDGDGGASGSAGANGAGSSNSKVFPAARPPVDDQRHGLTKVARKTGGSATAPEATSVKLEGAGEGDGHRARSYSCHAIVLATCSAYFKRRILEGSEDGSSARAPACARSAAPAECRAMQGRVQVMEEQVEEGELEAMEAVLRHGYIGSLVEVGGAAAQLSVDTLLQMRALANRFEMAQCAAHCGDELARRDMPTFDIAAINAVLGGRLPGPHAQPSHDRLVAASTVQLLHVFGDAEVVCGAWYDADSRLDSQLLELSLPSLLALLRSDSLTTRSENSVLMMADAWVAGPAGAACTNAQRRHVAEVVRLGQLTYAFTFDVLAAMPWLQLTADERMSLLRFAAAGLAGGKERHELLVRHSNVTGPAAWYDDRPRAAWAGPREVAMAWECSRKELAKHLLGRGVVEVYGSPCLFFNGFTVRPTLWLLGDPEPAAWFGHSVHVQPGGLKARDVKCKEVSSACAIELSGHRGAPLREVTEAGGWITCALSLECVSGQQMGDVAAWAPFIGFNGKMQGQVTLALCK